MQRRDSLLPASTDWVIEGRLAAMPLPSKDELRLLREAGFGLVVNLSEKPGPTAAAAAVGLEAVHIAVEDLTAPSLDQIDRFIAVTERCLASGRPVAVHCLGGCGRTGTMIACYLVKAGMAPLDAVDEVRKRRPCSIETGSQERAITKYARELQAREQGHEWE